MMSEYLILGPFFAFVFGLIMGSFINCLAWRLHLGENIWGRSKCPKCQNQISWYDNLPLLSFMLLKGRCRHCQKGISWHYPLVELITGLLFYFTFISFATEPLKMIYALVVLSILALVFIFDYRWSLIPISFLTGGALVVLLLGILINYTNLGNYLFLLVFFAFLGGFFFWLQYIITKKKGIGEGDIWLGAFLGLSFPSFKELLVVILSAYFIGSLVGLLFILLKRKQWGSQLPLGVFLTIGGVIALFWSEFIANWYLGLFQL